MKPDIKFEELRDFLDEKVEKFNRPDFIENDPIQIPHLFSKKEDIEIAGFLTATIAWGKREMIIKNSRQMMSLMGDEPHRFVTDHSEDDLLSLKKFVHRTFNGEDLTYFIRKLRMICQTGGLENIFAPTIEEENLKGVFSRFHELFFSDTEASFRSRKHVANPEKGSSAKRLSMYTRWMSRPSDTGVDFGIWKSVSPAKLSCPLDVHTGNVGRLLGLITRNANDWKTVEELDAHLRKFDPLDPVKYDFALFGLGVDEGWK